MMSAPISQLRPLERKLGLNHHNPNALHSLSVHNPNELHSSQRHHLNISE
jgi:hypothetical protein